VLTVVQETKMIGYTSGVVALLAMLLLRYWRHRHVPVIK